MVPGCIVAALILTLSNNGNPVVAKRLEVCESREALGIQIRLDGSMLDEVKHL